MAFKIIPLYLRMFSYLIFSPSCTFFALYCERTLKKSPNVLIFYLNPCSPSAFNTIIKHCHLVDNNSLSHPPCPHFKFWTTDKLSCVMALLSPPRQCQIAPLNEATTTSFHMLQNSSLTNHTII